MRRVDRLTDARAARMAPWADEWIGRALCTDPADRGTFEAAARRCYEFAGLPWHGRVVWVGNPLVGALASSIAAHILSQRDAYPVRCPVDEAVGGAVDEAVREAVDGAVGGAVRDEWYRYIGGQWWISWQAWTSFFRDVCGLDLPGDLWDRDRAYADAQMSAGWWWPRRDFLVVTDRAAEVHREQTGPAGWGSHRLHRPDGPAIRWRDGWALHAWHGVHVPAWVIESPTPDAIQREVNTEVRRCAIEHLGWDVYLAALGVAPVDESPDPGNPGHTLRLYDLPASAQVYGQPVRLVVMHNASRDRDGSRRRFAETVPADIQSAVAAQAWAFSVDEDVYKSLERAT